MGHNKSFAAGREPFRDRQDLQLQSSRVHGPFSFLNPTRAHFKPQNTAGTSEEPASDQDDSGKEKLDPASNVNFLWRSRDNRKGRHPLVVQRPEPGKEHDAAYLTPRRTNHPAEIMKVVLRMFTYYPVWDISWCVAYIFTWGSIVWCINGFFSFLPYIRPDLNFHGEVLDGGGITAFIGAVLFFELGSVLLMFEAVNENSAGCFGWAVEQLVDSSSDDNNKDNEKGQGRVRIHAAKDQCIHHHGNKSNFVGKCAHTTNKSITPSDQNTKDGKTWQWFPSLSSLRTHYLRELGFLASFSQFCGASIFSIAGITALPGINNNMSPGLTDGIYWVPQIVGGTGFIVSGTLYMLETQRNWYTPNPKVLGWHIAFWNLIGGIGFTLCGALGPAATGGNHGAGYQAACATFWGSFAFLVGSVLQLYESLQKNPVDEVTREEAEGMF